MPGGSDRRSGLPDTVQRQAYRADIQLVRALAVIVVVLYHLQVPAAQAGFLGVDAFFVVSGYLMQKVYRPQEGAADFYVRRARRLLPAYFATVFLTLVAAFFAVLPVEMAQVGEQVAYAALLASNVGFWAQNSYFSRAEFHPLLHLWSLGVEFQFYLLFPFLWFAVRRWRPALLVVCLASLGACLAVVSISPKTAFFMMPFRIWEFAAGMAVAIYASAISRSPGLGLAAFLLLALTLFLPIGGDGLGPFKGHPGIAAICVTILTAAILYWGLPDRMTAHWIGRAGQRIGDASYSIYLAHYPVIVFWFYQPFSGTLLGDGRVGSIMLPLILTALFSVMLFRLVEQPGRRLFSLRRALALSVALLVLAIAAPAGQALRFDPADRAIFAAWQDRGPYRCGKLFRILNPSATTCDLSQGPKGQILLIGDSYADAIKHSVVSAAASNGYGIRFSVGNAPLRSVAQDLKWVRAEMTRPDIRGTIFHYAPANLSENVVSQITDLSSSHSAALILAAPVYERSVPQYLYETRHGSPVPLLRVDAERINAKTTSVTTFDLADAFCEAAICALADDVGRPYYFDAGHLTLAASHRVEPLIEKAMAAILP